MTQCSNHAMFERFLEQGLANLNEKLTTIAEVLQEQNTISSQKMDHLAESQGARRELCGQRGAEIAALQSSDSAQWEELRGNRVSMTELNRVIWKREGALVLMSGLFSAAVTLLAKFLFH